MSCYIKKFPGEIRNQGWQGGLIATIRDKFYLGRVDGGSPRIREVCWWVVRVLQSGWQVS